jgi:DnaK suppressor protein
LLAERERLLLRAGVELGDGRPDPMDWQDRASGDARQRTDLALSDYDRKRLGEVEAALARMDAGSYGTCEETGEPIPVSRLRSEPTARYTVEALEMLEEERDRERVRGTPDDDALY